MLNLTSIIFALVLVFTPGSARPREQGLTTVAGADLKSRLASAIAQEAKQPAQQRRRFWTGYSFDVRPGRAFDAEVRDGQRAGGSLHGNVAPGAPEETRDLGVFVLHEANGRAILRVELRNLARHKSAADDHVIWLGHARQEESLSYLHDLIQSNKGAELWDGALTAIALHNDSRVSAMLVNFARRSPVEQFRLKAIMWLGQVENEQAFLLDLIRDEQESVEVRRQAVFAVGVWGRDANAQANLQTAYGAIENQAVKERILQVAFMSRSDEGIAFLDKTAGNDPDPHIRRLATVWLNQTKSPDALERPKPHPGQP